MDLPIQAYLRATAARHRDTERVGPFLATFDATTAHPFLSYAIPDDRAMPKPGDVAALRDAYERRDRVPRLEYLESVAPAVEAALLAGGFSVEARLALMTCSPDEATALPPPTDVELVRPDSDDELRAGYTVANVAFGDPDPPSDAQVERLRHRLEAGGIAVLARDATAGDALGWGAVHAAGGRRDRDRRHRRRRRAAAAGHRGGDHRAAGA